MARLSDRNKQLTAVPAPQSPDRAGFITDTGNNTTVPDGWLECDGSAVSRTTYAELFAEIGTTYGAGDGSTTFNLPNGNPSTKVFYATNTLGTPVTVPTTDIADLRFTGLTVGKTYRVSFQADLVVNGTDDDAAELRARHNGVTIASLVNRGDSIAVQRASTSAIFTADVTSLTFDYIENSGTTGSLNSGSGITFATVEELPNHEFNASLA